MKALMRKARRGTTITPPNHQKVYNIKNKSLKDVKILKNSITLYIYCEKTIISNGNTSSFMTGIIHPTTSNTIYHRFL